MSEGRAVLFVAPVEGGAVRPVAALLFALALAACLGWLRRKRAAGWARTPAAAR